MAAGVLNLVIEQGSKYTLTLWLAEAEGGDVMPLTGYSARMVVAGSTPIWWTTASTHLVLDTVAGSLTLTVPTAETTVLDFKAVPYQITLIDPDDEAQRLLQGTVSLAPDAELL